RNKVCSTALLYLMWLLLVITVLMASAPVVIAAGGQLEVRRISPAGDEVEPGREIAIQFDRTMVALGDMRRDIADLDIHVEPDPGCEWRWLNTSELACRLAADTRLLPATQY